MRLVVGSAFRNSADRLAGYFNQVVALQAAMFPWEVRVVAAEGDSTDTTRELLLNYSGVLAVTVLDAGHGGPVFGSTESPERLRLMSTVGNRIFEAVEDDDDVLVYVESDLLWDPKTIKTLVLHACQRSLRFDIFAPFVMAGEAFYDTWGFRRNEERFSPFPPYHPALGEDPICRVDSAGSCLVMRGEIAQRCRIRNDYGLVGWCEDARRCGYKIGVVPALRVRQT